MQIWCNRQIRRFQIQRFGPMADILTVAERSERMSRIKSKNSKAEVRVRQIVHRMGFRYRLHNPTLPGKPDLVLRQHNKIIFIHGCYWHRHGKCRRLTIPESNAEFWQRKFQQNIERDQRIAKQLADLGWKVLVVWECETKDEESLKRKLKRFLSGVKR